MSALEGQVVDLELRFMKLERFVEELSDVVADQRRSIDALTAEVARLRGLVDQGDEAAPGEPPPHY